MPFAKKEDYNAWKRKRYLKNRSYELERKKKYQSTEKGKIVNTKSVTAYRKRFPERQRARAKLIYHLGKGRIVKQPCRCGAENVQAHHPDYSKPLDVVWLCPGCHGMEHRKKPV